MEFRPCIDIHNGQIKQIVGSSLTDAGDNAQENFVAAKNADFYAKLYMENHIKGGHIILLNPSTSEYYEATKAQAMLALRTYPGGLQIGGGINDKNAMEYIEVGASHVIVTSFVFKDGYINMENLNRICKAVGKERLVLDLSCRWNKDAYYMVTDRWQKYTDEIVNADTLDKLSEYCDEFLIHAVDVEGKSQGIEKKLVKLLGEWCDSEDKPSITYAGGVHSYEDIDLLNELGKGRINVTIGSALDIFGGSLEFGKVVQTIKNYR